MSKINASYTNPTDIALNGAVTSAGINTIKNTINTYIQAISPTSPVVLLTGATTLTANNQDVYLGGTASYDVTLPAIPAGNTNIFFNFSRTAANKNGATPIVIRLLPNAGNTINGASSYTFWTKDSTLTLNCNTSVLGTDWKITSESVNLKPLNAKIFQNAVTTLSTGVTKIVFQAESYDDNTDMTEGAASSYVCTVPGWYKVEANLYIASGASSDTLIVVLKNGSEYERGNALNVSGVTALHVSCTVKLAVGEDITIAGNSNPAKNTLSGASLTYFTVTALKLA